MAKRTDRIQLMLDAEEVKALDDWRFEMRMPSRAAAMRALMRLELKLDLDLDDLGVDPHRIASGRIGLVQGPAIEPESLGGVLAALPVDSQTAQVARELAKRRSVAPATAIREACEMALAACPDVSEPPGTAPRATQATPVGSSADHRPNTTKRA